MIYRVWAPEDGQTEEDAHRVEATPLEWGAEEAAKQYAERRHADADYPDEQIIRVRSPDGKLTSWSVLAYPSVDFRALELKDT